VAGTWNLPGGRVEPGEPLVDAMQREIQEEAGLAVELKGLLFVDQVIADGGESESRMRFVFAGTPRDPRALTPKAFADEHSLCARWFARGELSMLRMRNPYALEMVERAERQPVLLPIESLRARYGDL
jgi:8-oxo-dGTP pyrophosphatase MutT (NUDIX family)